MFLNDLTSAYRFSDKVIAMKNGKDVDVSGLDETIVEERDRRDV